MTLFTPYRSALILLLVLSALLLWRGTSILLLPPLYRYLHPYLYNAGYLLIALGVLLLCLHRWAIAKLLWMFQEIHRLITGLLMLSVLGIDGMMHAFNIPHIEGWWLPLFGGGAAVNMLYAWLQRLRRLTKQALR